jgi:hypothetical protein
MCRPFSLSLKPSSDSQPSGLIPRQPEWAPSRSREVAWVLYRTHQPARRVSGRPQQVVADFMGEHTSEGAAHDSVAQRPGPQLFACAKHPRLFDKAKQVIGVDDDHATRRASGVEGDCSERTGPAGRPCRPRVRLDHTERAAVGNAPARRRWGAVDVHAVRSPDAGGLDNRGVHDRRRQRARWRNGEGDVQGGGEHSCMLRRLDS